MNCINLGASASHVGLVLTLCSVGLLVSACSGSFAESDELSEDRVEQGGVMKSLISSREDGEERVTGEASDITEGTDTIESTVRLGCEQRDRGIICHGGGEKSLTYCPPGGAFDVCFPNSLGAPSGQCGLPTEAGSLSSNMTAWQMGRCYRQVCSSRRREPIRGFFNRCCAKGGAQQFDQSCVLDIQAAGGRCSGVANFCAAQCPTSDQLRNSAPLSPPGQHCVNADPILAAICSVDPLCCQNEWDSGCAAQMP